jgi:uncharacterized pyridoxamine 5'-phosphate oxidase family protein
MEEILAYLKECKTFYIATSEGDQPRVRPFGAITEFEGNIYLVTNNSKKVYQQLLQNPKLEISGTNKDSWIRLEATAVRDDRKAAREKMLTDVPSLSGMYTATDERMEVLYLKDATATICYFTKEPKTIKF